jgi:uncharacterized protein involved in oxidation of intracellular sulfur
LKEGTNQVDTKCEKEYLFVINDGPYGSERSYNGLRMAMNLAKQEGALVRVFLIGDGVQCAVKEQSTPKGFYNIERMLSFIANRGEVAT